MHKKIGCYLLLFHLLYQVYVLALFQQQIIHLFYLMFHQLMILLLLVMHLIISVINMKSIKAREFICGKPRILIYRGYFQGRKIPEKKFSSIYSMVYDTRKMIKNNFGITYFNLPHSAHLCPIEYSYKYLYIIVLNLH